MKWETAREIILVLLFAGIISVNCHKFDGDEIAQMLQALGVCGLLHSPTLIKKVKDRVTK